MPKYDLDPFQNEAASRLFYWWRHYNRLLVVMPTGTGKTIVFSEVAACFNGADYGVGNRVLVIAHREELIRQAAAKLEAATGEEPAVEMGEWWADESGMFPKSRIVVASVQSLMNPARLDRFDSHEFGLIIADEAHHAVADTWQKIIGHFSQGGAKVAGFTATADRADEISLGKVFDYVAFEYDILQAIKDGYLCKVRQEYVRVSVDFSHIEPGQLSDDRLDVILSEERACHEIALGTIKGAGDRPTIVFTAGVGQAHMLEHVLNRYKPGSARAVSSTLTDRLDRADIVRDFGNGEFQYLVNCGVFLEGFDVPRIACVAMARPTTSRAVYAQAIGRGTRGGWRRPIPGKEDCLVLDFVGNSGRHKLVSCAEALGGIFDQDVIDHATQLLLRKKGGGYVDETLLMAQEMAEERRALERAAVLAKGKLKRRTVNPFDVLALPSLRESGYTAGHVPTPKMNEALEAAGIKPQGLTMGEAKRLLTEVRRRREEGLCSYKQLKMIARYGYSPATTFKEAGEILDALQKNNWRPLNHAKWQGAKTRKAAAAAESERVAREQLAKHEAALESMNDQADKPKGSLF